jgi:protein polybromo-1
LYKDAYELQRFFIQRRDELCKNGEYLLSGALAYKLGSLDSYVTSLIGSLTQSFDESEALLVEQRYKPLETRLVTATTSASSSYRVREGDFYYVSRSALVGQIDKITDTSNEPMIVCALKVNANSSRFVAQLYLRPDDEQLIDSQAKKLRKFCANEVFKSDLYAVLDASVVNGACYVMGMRDFINVEPSFTTDTKNSKVAEEDGDSKEPPVAITKADIFVCEYLYSSCFRYFRKIIHKKWSPLSFINSVAHPSTTRFNFILHKRPVPLCVTRSYLNEPLVAQLSAAIEERVNRIENESGRNAVHLYRDVQYDSPPAAALQASKEKDADEVDANAIDEDPEVMKTAKYYEQLVYPPRTGELYKLGDFIYVKYQQLAGANDPSTIHKHPMIVRIDRLWSTIAPVSCEGEQPVKSYYFRGPLFLRPTDVAHEPTRLFYKSEVVKEITRQITGSLDQIVPGETGTGSTKCAVMNQKSYVSSRLTEIDERDVYMCESKYSILTKQFRKGTKGLKKFDLSAKCNEDEILFLRRELQIRKHLSPILATMDINYDEDFAKVAKLLFIFGTQSNSIRPFLVF